MPKEKKLKQRRGAGKSGNELLKQYPWLTTFNEEVRACMRNPQMEITSSHVLKLVTFLETKISPEVSILKTKPNRATKFLAQIRKRMAIAKMSGWLTDLETEQELLPTFGLLLMHYVNITLVSSKIEKLGGQKVAADLYIMLKLMLQIDIEYVLDVVLCSNLAENASNQGDAGFEMFSIIVDDWRSYTNKDSSQMKACYIAALLSESPEGNRYIEGNLPSETTKDFIEYLNTTLDLKLKVSKSYILSNIVQQIKSKRTIIRMSRCRLVIVSERTLSKRGISQLEEDEDSDAESDESSGSTVVNITSSKNQEYHADSSQNDLGFRLDTTASHHNDEWRNQRSDQYDSIVSSSTTKRRRKASGSSTDTLTIKRNFKTKLYEIKKGSDVEEQEKEEKSSGQEARHTRRSRTSLSKNVTVEIPSRSLSMDVEVGDRLPLSPTRNGFECDNATSEIQQRELIGKKLREELGAEIDSDHDDGHEEDESDIELDEGIRYEKTEAEDTIGRAKQNKSRKIVSDDDEQDSDLEVLSETFVKKVSESDDNMSTSTNERDEAEAESGEDVVPNYDEDSDEAIMDIDEQGHNVSSETVVVPRTSTAKDNLNLTTDDKGSFQEPTSGTTTKNDGEKSESESEIDCDDYLEKVKASNKRGNTRGTSGTSPENDGKESGNESEIDCDYYLEKVKASNRKDNTRGKNKADLQTSPTSTNNTDSNSQNSQDTDSVIMILSTNTNGTASPIMPNKKFDQSVDQDNLSQLANVRTRSSSASPTKTSNSNDHDKESQSQLPSQSSQPKVTRGKKRGGCATAAAATAPEVSLRRITRACTATITENSETTTTTDSQTRITRAVRGRGRGRGMASTSKE